MGRPVAAAALWLSADVCINNPQLFNTSFQLLGEHDSFFQLFGISPTIWEPSKTFFTLSKNFSNNLVNWLVGVQNIARTVWTKFGKYFQQFRFGNLLK